MKFAEWLAIREGVKNPEGVAAQWRDEAPTSPVQNAGAVEEWAARHAAEDIAEDLIGIVALGREVYSPVYQEPIDGHLLTEDTGVLGEGLGVLAWPRPSRFSFLMEGRNTGDILIRHPPMIFDNDMQVLLESIIWHELRHAHDWAAGVPSSPSPSELYRVDIELYAKHVMEARGYADQLNFLLGRLEGNPDKVMDVLSRPGSGMELDVRLRQVARSFVQHYAKESMAEGIIGRWLAPAAIAAASMLGGGPPGDSSPAPQQPAQVRIHQVEDQYAQQAALVAQEMAGLFHARHFLTR